MSHWYKNATGLPCYEVPKVAGGMRDTTLRDARKMGLVPSVTTVLQVVAKPALTNWMVDQGIMAALTLPREAGEPDDAFVKRVKADSKAQAIAAAEEGNRIHDAIEQHYLGRYVPDQYQPHVAAVAAKIAGMFPDITDWIPESSFAHPDGYGGKVDLHSPSTGIVCDWKSKDGDLSGGKKLAYDQHWQLAAYQHGLGLRQNICANVFVSRTHPGSVAAQIWDVNAVAYGLEHFRLALALWQHEKQFDSSFTKEAA